MKVYTTLFIALVVAACSSNDSAESLSPVSVTPAVEASTWDRGAMVVAANPHATDAAIHMLELGGHAVDAAIAAHAVLGLVEPQSSGIGGGVFLLVYEHQDKSLIFHDGRESAPAGATVDMFMRDGKVMNFYQAWQSGIAVGVPGAIAMYKTSTINMENYPGKRYSSPP